MVQVCGHRGFTTSIPLRAPTSKQTVAAACVESLTQNTLSDASSAVQEEVFVSPGSRVGRTNQSWTPESEGLGFRV